MQMPPLITAAELQNKFTEYKIIDATWFMPTEAKKGYDEYLKERIPDARFLDIDEISDKETDLPHMLPAQDFFEQKISEMGISNSDKIVVYDTHGIFSSPRVWWMFRVFGHKTVQVLDGGLPAWKRLGGKLESGAPAKPAAGKFAARFSNQKLALKSDIEKILETNGHLILDARSPARFSGQEPEPRKGLRSGNIPGSKNLHYKTLLNDDGMLLQSDILRSKLDELGADEAINITATCGSGITACIITLALEIARFPNWRVYDGSWAEWGRG